MSLTPLYAAVHIKLDRFYFSLRSVTPRTGLENPFMRDPRTSEEQVI